MARIRRCHTCGHENPPAKGYCVVDGTDLEGVPIEDTDQLRPSPDLPKPEPADNPLAAFMTENESADFALQFPWGEVVVRERLAIGRDDIFSPIAEHLLPYGEVSGAHAEIWIEGNSLRLRHLGKTNPTYVNGTPYHHGDVVVLRDGDTLLLSRQVAVRVKAPGT